MKKAEDRALAKFIAEGTKAWADVPDAAQWVREIRGRKSMSPKAEEIPGYILDLFDGSAWITQDGRVTDKWEERGVWPTPKAAQEAMERYLEKP